MDFNPIVPTTMHVDINSCFATIEQQANPLIRNRPVVVAAYVKDYGCILAASREAKKMGVKTGMRVKEGKLLAPGLVVLPPDPPKYRMVNRQLLSLLSVYTAHIRVESIDEMVLEIRDKRREMGDYAREIKQRIKNEIGEWITVSIGIAPNRYLAKVASDIQKPDGLVTICRDNIMETFGRMTLTDFCGIKEGNAGRLKSAGIMTPIQFFSASKEELRYAFRSVVGMHWWLRLHGYEDGGMYKEFEKDTEEDQKSFGQSYVLGTPYPSSDWHLWQILAQLVMKMGRRLRNDGFVAYGVGISTLFSDHTHWHTQEKKLFPLFADTDFYSAMRTILTHAPQKPVKLLAITSYALERDSALQPSLFPEENKKRDVTAALDAIANRYGEFVIHSGRMVDMEQKVLDRISFGKV